jgi:DNA-binding CsgD family transcriptional regulator
VLASRAQTELAASGARSRRVRRGGLEALTPSERRVGGLAARGLTTREMAEALFVTPKTVEFHLRNIYQKLDIGSRGELAAHMGQLTET